jgi:hypothetical protein
MLEWPGWKYCFEISLTHWGKPHEFPFRIVCSLAEIRGQIRPDWRHVTVVHALSVVQWRVVTLLHIPLKFRKCVCWFWIECLGKNNDADCFVTVFPLQTLAVKLKSTLTSNYSTTKVTVLTMGGTDVGRCYKAKCLVRILVSVV